MLDGFLKAITSLPQSIKVYTILGTLATISAGALIHPEHCGEWDTTMTIRVYIARTIVIAILWLHLAFLPAHQKAIPIYTLTIRWALLLSTLRCSLTRKDARAEDQFPFVFDVRQLMLFRTQINTLLFLIELALLMFPIDESKSGTFAKKIWKPATGMMRIWYLPYQLIRQDINEGILPKIHDLWLVFGWIAMEMTFQKYCFSKGEEPGHTQMEQDQLLDYEPDITFDYIARRQSNALPRFT